VFISVARSTIQDVQANFTAYQFFSERPAISAMLQARLNASFSSLYATVPYCQVHFGFFSVSLC